MTNDVASYKIQDDGSVCRIILPPRKLGELRQLAWSSLAFGCFMMLFMAVWIGTPVSWGLELLQKGERFGLIVVVFGVSGLGGLRISLLMVAGSISALRDTTACTLELRAKKLVCIEKFGLVKWKRKVRIRDITKLSVGGFQSKAAAAKSPGITRGLAKTESVIAHQSNEKFPIAIAYPREILVPLANELAERLDRQLDNIELGQTNAPFPHAPLTADVVASQVSDRPRIAVDLNDPDAPAVPTQPAHSTIARHEVDGSTIFEVPPAGIWEGSRGLMVFSMLWNGFCLLYTSPSPRDRG